MTARNLNVLRRNGWTLWHLSLAIGLALAAAFVMRDALVDIWRLASRDEESSHIFLVPIVMAWLVWVRRVRVREIRPERSWLGPLLIAAGWMISFAGDKYLIQSFWHLGAILVVVGAVIAVIGPQWIRQFFPAFAVMLFLVPVPALVRQQIAIPLESTAAQVTQIALEMTGTLVTRSGNVLSINGREVAIAEACNGLRMVFALTLVAYAFAFGATLRTGVALLVVAASPLIAIASNVLRLMPTVWIYGFASIETADRFHDWSAWFMLPIVFGCLTGLVNILRWARIPVSRFTLAYG